MTLINNYSEYLENIHSRNNIFLKQIKEIVNRPGVAVIKFAALYLKMKVGPAMKAAHAK